MAHQIHRSADRPQRTPERRGGRVPARDCVIGVETACSLNLFWTEHSPIPGHYHWHMRTRFDKESPIKSIQRVVVLSSMLLAGCVHTSNEQEEALPLVRFPPPPENAEVVHLTAAAEGTLVYEQGCFKLRRRGQPLHTIIWHSHFSLLSQDGKPGVLDENSRESAFAGDDIRIGGGVIESVGSNVENYALAIECGAPYTSANTLRRVKP